MQKIKLRLSHKAIYFNWRAAMSVIFVMILLSCSQHQKQNKVPIKLGRIDRPIEKHADDSVKDSISLFSLTLSATGKGDTLGFVSISDIDILPGNVNSPPDSIDRLVVPSLEGKTARETMYIALKSNYRRRLLNAAHISEKDSLYVYDCTNNVLLSFAISSLKTVASLSPYEDYDQVQHSASDYMLGFEINRAVLKGLSDQYYSNALVYIGAANPFTSGQMHPMIWKRISPANFPSVGLSLDDKEILRGYKVRGAYNFELDGFSYYLQQFIGSNDTSSLRLIVLGPDKKMVFNRLYYQGESSTPSSISVEGESKNDLQWAGRLFKNRPPLVLGFESIEFGCPIYPFMNKRHDEVILNCDNRH